MRPNASGSGATVASAKRAIDALNVAQGGDGFVVAEQRQHTAHLIEHRGRRWQIGALERVAEEAVEPLLDIAQRRLRFRHDGTHRQPILRAPRQLRHPRAGLRQRLTVARLREPVDHLQRTPFVFGFDLRQLLDAEIDKQQRRRDFQPHGFAQIRRQLGELFGHAADRLDRRDQRSRVQLVRRLARKQDLMLELGSVSGAPATT